MFITVSIAVRPSGSELSDMRIVHREVHVSDDTADVLDRLFDSTRRAVEEEDELN